MFFYETFSCASDKRPNPGADLAITFFPRVDFIIPFFANMVLINNKPSQGLLGALKYPFQLPLEPSQNPRAGGRHLK